LRGREFSWAATAARSSRLCTDRSVLLGKYYGHADLLRERLDGSTGE
jgi:hypothetical protein